VASENQLLWLATCDLGDHFSQLAGSARYPGMLESEIFLFIACRALDIVEKTDYVKNMVSPAFIDAAKPVLPKVNEHLLQLSTHPHNIWHTVSEFTSYYDKKLDGERTAQWRDFCAIVETRTS
jgi:hypothetical protein